MERAGRDWGWTAPVARPQQRNGGRHLEEDSASGGWQCGRTAPVARLHYRERKRRRTEYRDGRTQRGLQIQSRGEWHLEKDRAGGPATMQTVEEGRNGQR
jgi:hypothetical protein